MIVCLCRRVSERDIHRAVHAGTSSFDDLQTDLGVATACGSCLACAHDTWAQACSLEYLQASPSGIRPWGGPAGSCAGAAVAAASQAGAERVAQPA